MSNFRRSLGGLIAASLVFATVSGCGGAGSSNGAPITTQPVVPLTGGAVTTSVVSPTTVVASNVPQQIEVTLPGGSGPVVVWIPAGIAVAAGQSISVIPTATVFFQNMTGGSARAPGNPPGTITINNLASGVTIDNGSLNANLGLPSGNYEATIYGPFQVSNGSQQLNVQAFQFSFQSNGTAMSFPTTINGQIPANGSSNFGNSVTLTFAPAFGTGPATMTIVHANGTLKKTVQVAGASCVFSELGNNGENAQIPLVGVQSVAFSH